MKKRHLRSTVSHITVARLLRLNKDKRPTALAGAGRDEVTTAVSICHDNDNHSCTDTESRAVRIIAARHGLSLTRAKLICEHLGIGVVA